MALSDRTRALLGDRAAQERITERGELLECPFCGNKNIRTSNWGMWRCWCPECFGKSEDMLWERDAVKHWNTRAPMEWYDLDDGLSYCEAIEKAIESLRDNHFPETAKMVPLTPEQLREMDGQPIWIEHDEDPKYNHVWMIWNNEIGMRHNLAGYNIFWRAYACQPAHIDREAWEPFPEYEDYRKMCQCPNCGESIDDNKVELQEAALKGEQDG